jgi:hypothetical protein
MTTPAVHDCPFCRGAGCSHCGGGEVDDREIYQVRPGIYAGVTDHDYHGATEWLSSSGINELLKPGGPARFRHRIDHGDTEHKAHYDEGHAAHAEVLGTGLEVVEIKAKDWRTKAAQDARDKAYADGKVPLLTAAAEMVRGMGAAVRATPEAMELLAGGRPEVSAFTVDAQTWTQMRARPDYLIEHGSGLATVIDYKTSADASPRGFAKSAAKFGYPVQEATYKRVLRALGIEVVQFVFLAQEKTPPYLLSFHENDPEDVALADRLVSRGIDIYAECLAANEWPGYGSQINIMRMSRWARYDAEEALL